MHRPSAAPFLLFCLVPVLSLSCGDPIEPVTAAGRPAAVSSARASPLEATDAGVSFARVDADLARYDEAAAELSRAAPPMGGSPSDVAWVQGRLQYMFDLDTLMRDFWSTPGQNGYSEAETAYFVEQFLPRNDQVDSANTAELKALLGVHDWIRISVFGADADFNAFVIVQHADLDAAFQQHVLSILEAMVAIGETQPRFYAYLFDRVAASWLNPSERALQRFGTQGDCIGPGGTWEPLPMEDPDGLDARRSAYGLGPFAEYKALMDGLCTGR